MTPLSFSLCRLEWRNEGPGIWYAGGHDYCVGPAGMGYSTAKFRGRRIGAPCPKEEAQQLCQKHNEDRAKAQW